MKQIFKPVSLILIAFSIWITWVCASLLQFDDTGNLIVHSYSIWGDWSAHFTFISALRERGFSWIAGDNPLFPGIPFQYPFLSHALTYIFSRLTFLDTIHATYVSSLLLIFILPFTLYTTLRKLTLSAWGSLAATLSFLLIGGFQWLDGSLKTTEPLTNQFDQASIFTQFILFEFFPQRAFLFGILIFLGCVTYALNVREWTLKRKGFLGIVLSLTALLHIHTWIAVGTLLVFLWVFPPFDSKKLSRKSIFIFGAAVAVLSGAFLSFLLLRGDASSTRMSWDFFMPGWAQNEKAHIAKASDMNFIIFWIFNTGFFLPLAIFGMWVKRRDVFLRACAAAGILIFVIAETFNIQPYFYDNLKLFTYAFLFFTPFVGIAFETIAGFKKFPKYLGVGMVVLLVGVQTYSGAHDLRAFQEGLQQTGFFSTSEFEMAEQFKGLRNSPNDIVLINPRHNHWVPCLTGNPVAMGFAGWLWSWGISYGTRENQIKEVLIGGPHADEVLNSLHLAYAAIQTGEKIQNQEVNVPYFDAHFKKIMGSGAWSVYSLKDRITSPTTSVR
jgi:hypothetical protein